ncbi:MAG: hypothetical protein P8J87_11250 [Verrucomicrobiales bacterium]|nr:hypothetical protein [Verrucomicrobiales bacterium]
MEEEIPDIRDIVPPEQLVDPRLLTIVIVLASLALITALAFLIFTKRSKAHRSRPPRLPRPPSEIALAELEKIKSAADGLSASEIADQVSTSIDTFLHRQHGVPARFRTVDELTRRRSPEDPPPLPAIQHFAPLLDHLETLKFSSPVRKKENAQALIGQALTLIQS